MYATFFSVNFLSTTHEALFTTTLSFEKTNRMKRLFAKLSALLSNPLNTDFFRLSSVYFHSQITNTKVSVLAFSNTHDDLYALFCIILTTEYPLRYSPLLTVLTESIYTILVEPLAQKLQVQIRRSFPTQSSSVEAVSIKGHDNIFLEYFYQLAA